MTRPRRLRTKVTGYFLVLVFSWSVMMAGSLEYLFSRQMYDSVRDKGVHITRALAIESLTRVHYEDYSALSDLVRSHRRSLPDLRYVFFLDANGTPIWSTFRDGTPRGLVRLARGSPDLEPRLVRLGRELVYAYSADVAGARIATGLSLVAAERFVWATIPHVVWMGAAGLFAVFALALYVSRPVEALSRAVERAVVLDQATGGTPATFEELAETSAIASRFHDVLDRLEERTRQLDGARKLAYLGEISTSIAHEVNNPLGVIVMNAGFLQKRLKSGQIDPAATKEVERLSTAARRATLVVQKFLQFTRYSTRPGDVRQKKTRLDAIVREALDLLEDRIRNGRTEVTTHFDEDVPAVLCEEQGIQQVIFNLLTNALDAGGTTIDVRLRLGEGTVVLEVKDTGKGMEPEVVQRATEPFFTTKAQGSGLGLAISRSIVEAHRGRLDIDSAPGRGTTVSVELPRREVTR